MPPKAKYTKEQIVEKAYQMVKEQGVDALTARDLGNALHTSVSPIFTCFSGMGELIIEVAKLAEKEFFAGMEEGLKAPIPFLGVGMQFIRFAKEKPHLYRMLFMDKEANSDYHYSNANLLKLFVDSMCPSIIKLYGLKESDARAYLKNMWVVGHSFSTLCVSGDNPFTDEEIAAQFQQFSLCLCKAYKEIPGFATGDYDKNAFFEKLNYAN